MRTPRGYTLVEMAVTLATLLILLGLMVSLARYVRSDSAQALTQDLLLKLDRLMDQYVSRNGGRPPAVGRLLQGNDASERMLASLARRNNEEVMRALRRLGDFSAEFPSFSSDGLSLRDAWGSPIVFMPEMHPSVGMCDKGWFLFSAGPDCKYLTRGDNLYSYEVGGSAEERPTGR